MIGVKVTHGKAKERLQALAALAGDEKVMRNAMRPAAEPLAEAMRQNIDRIRGRKFPRRHSNLTRNDVTIQDAPSEIGTVKLLIGLRGGKNGRAFVGRFLERGTSKMPAYPWRRPAQDAEGGERIKARLVANLNRVFFGGRV